MKKITYILIALGIIFFFYLQNVGLIFNKISNSSQVITQNKGSSSQIILGVTNDNLPFDVYGESCYLNKPLSLEEILEMFDAKVVGIERLSHGVSYYCYSSSIKYRGVMVGGKLVNLHVFMSSEQIKLGSPLIFDGY